MPSQAGAFLEISRIRRGSLQTIAEPICGADADPELELPELRTQIGIPLRRLRSKRERRILVTFETNFPSALRAKPRCLREVNMAQSRTAEHSNTPTRDREAAAQRAAVAVQYQPGFGNHFVSEAVPGALPVGRNSPQRPPLGLYAEQLSGTSFTT